jgi:hypothetical protein
MVSTLTKNQIIKTNFRRVPLFTSIILVFLMSCCPCSHTTKGLLTGKWGLEQEEDSLTIEKPQEEQTPSKSEKKLIHKDKTKSLKSKTKSQKDKSKSLKSKTKFQKDKSKSLKSKTKSQKDKTKSLKSKTKSQKDKSKSLKSKTKSVKTKTEETIVPPSSEADSIETISLPSTEVDSIETIKIPSTEVEPEEIKKVEPEQPTEELKHSKSWIEELLNCLKINWWYILLAILVILIVIFLIKFGPAILAVIKAGTGVSGVGSSIATPKATAIKTAIKTIGHNKYKIKKELIHCSNKIRELLWCIKRKWKTGWSYEQVKATDSCAGEYKDLFPEKRSPTDNGKWSGEKGNSKWTPDPNYCPQNDNPDNETWRKILDKEGEDGFFFKNDNPDFDPVSRFTVKIKGFSSKIKRNFNKADKALAKANKLFRNDEKEVKKYREDNGLTWHEDRNQGTMQLVPKVINNNISHNGGRAERDKEDKIKKNFLRSGNRINLYKKLRLQPSKCKIDSKSCFVPSDIDMKQKDKKGRANLERMKNGYSPITKNGEVVKLYVSEDKRHYIAITSKEHNDNKNILYDPKKQKGSDKQVLKVGIERKFWNAVVEHYETGKK